MTHINDLLHKSEMKTELLTIAEYLDSDSNYTKEDAVNDLLKFIEKHNF